MNFYQLFCHKSFTNFEGFETFSASSPVIDYLLELCVKAFHESRGLLYSLVFFLKETSKVSNLTEANSSDASRSRDTNRDSTRDTHLKPISKHTWTSSSSSSLSRHSDTPPGERASSSSFRPTQFQAYLHNNQMIEPINYDPATGM